MSRLVFENESFQCILECSQCDYILENGNRCKRRVCIGAPTCWQHTIILYGVKVKKSNIENAGSGLFTTKPFIRNEFICPYIGEMISEDCLESRYPADQTAPYATQAITDDEYIDSACLRGIGSLANFANIKNAKIVEYNDEVWLQAIKYIRANEEILVDYGPFYQFEPHTTNRKNNPVDDRPC